VKRLPVVLLILLLAGSVAARDISLSEAVELALVYDARISTASETIEAAEAATLAAWGGYLPRLGLNAGYTRSWSGPSTTEIPGYGEVTSEEKVANGLSLSATATLPLFAGGAIFNGIDSAQCAQSVAEQSAVATTEQVRYDARSAYVSLYRSQALLTSAERSLESAEEQLRYMDKLTEVGSLSSADALKAQAAADRSALSVIESRSAYSSAMANLAYLCGLPVDEELTPSTELFVRPPATELDEAMEQLGDTPTMRMARDSYAQAQASQRAATSAYWPSLSLQGGYTWSDSTPLEDDWLEENYSFSLGVYLSWTVPFMDGFSTNARLASARVEELRARLSQRDTERQLELQLRLTLDSIASAEEKVSVSRSSYERAVDDLELAQRRLELGSGTLLAALEAEANLSATETALTDAEASFALACFSLDLLLATE
jgi:outer membrane protein TolC